MNSIEKKRKGRPKKGKKEKRERKGSTIEYIDSIA